LKDVSFKLGFVLSDPRGRNSACGGTAQFPGRVRKDGHMNNAQIWLKSKRWGMFIHYLSILQNNADNKNSMGKETDWNTCVNELNVELIADQAKEVGADYLIFTIMQGKRYMAAPNKTYDSYLGCKPSEACAERDVILELSEALHKRGIDLMLYYTGDGPCRDDEAAEKMCWNEGSYNMNFITRWSEVLKEYSLRYGTRIKGWWIDGTYQGFSDEAFEMMRAAAKAGNPDAAVCFNYYGCATETHSVKLDGMGEILFGDFYQKVVAPTKYCDYTAGELVSFNGYPESPMINGAVPHVLSFLGMPEPLAAVYNGWGAPGSKYSGHYMRKYIKTFNKMGGVVSVDVCMYRDGHIDEEQMNVLREIEKEQA